MNKNSEDRAFSSRPDNESEEVEFHDYHFHMRDGSDKFGKGFLAVANSFIAVGEGSGDLKIVVPLDQVQFVEEIQTPAGRA